MAGVLVMAMQPSEASRISIPMAAPAKATATRGSTARRPRILHTRATGVTLICALLVLWEISARVGWVGSDSWPRFSTVLTNTADGLLSGELVKVMGSTLYRMALGYIIGCLVGIALGLLLGSAPVLYSFVNPIIETLRPLPSPAIIPPLILFLGVDDALKLFIISLATFFPVFVNTVGGVRGTSSVLLQTAQTFRVGRLRTMFQVILPSAMPAIFSGLRISLALALVVAVIAEMISGDSGVGYYIIQTQYAMKPDAMYSAVLCLAVVGYAFNRSFLSIERWLLSWYGDAQRRS